MLLLNIYKEKLTFKNASKIQNMKNCKGCKDLFSAWCWYIVFWIIMVETGCCSRQVRGELKYLKFDEVLDK